MELPDPPKREALMQLLRSVMTKNVEEVHLKAGEPLLVRWWGVEGDQLDLDLPEPSMAHVLRRINLGEVVATSCESALGEAARRIDRVGLRCSHAVVGTHTVLHRWLGVDLTAPRPRFCDTVLGGRITASDDIADDVLLLLVATDPMAGLSDVCAGLKVSMEVP